MKKKKHHIVRILLCIIALITICNLAIKAQQEDSIYNNIEYKKQIIDLEKPLITKDGEKTIKQKKCIPDIKRAMWLAIVLPGAGQIYNRKYWKLPIIYGGLVGCVYALNWNNSMYKDYSQAYRDIMDNDPNTQSYNQFLHLGNKITAENMKNYQDIFKKRKDKYRRWRDLSVVCMVGVYALSIIDAYVDASLSEFDISDDLSLKITPSVLNNNTCGNNLKKSAIGLRCSLNF